MKTSEFNKTIHVDNEKLNKNLNCHGWVMGHGWGSHGRTWKMGGWGQNIILETLHVLVGYVSVARTAWASKRTLGSLLKLDMFQWVVGFKADVSWCMIFDW
jgi:hypothetical protein